MTGEAATSSASQASDQRHKRSSSTQPQTSDARAHAQHTPNLCQQKPTASRGRRTSCASARSRTRCRQTRASCGESRRRRRCRCRRCRCYRYRRRRRSLTVASHQSRRRRRRQARQPQRRHGTTWRRTQFCFEPTERLVIRRTRVRSEVRTIVPIMHSLRAIHAVS